jgi:long-chain acyl-CoA synthetase
VLKSSEVQGHPWSIGKPIPGGSMRIVDPDTGELVGPGEVGELEYSGPNVTMGYATSSADLTRGDDFGFSLRTGDLAIQGDDGFLRIVGRRKRFIKVYGSRVNLDHVERMVQESGLEAVCTGSDDSLVVHVVGDVERESLQETVASFIGAHKNAVRVSLVRSIPRAESGKVLYSELMGDSNG